MSNGSRNCRKTVITRVRNYKKPVFTTFFLNHQRYNEKNDDYFYGRNRFIQYSMHRSASPGQKFRKEYPMSSQFFNLDKRFGLTANKTNVRTELLAGLSTFLTMGYIVALNPNILTGFQTGTPLWNAIFISTCLCSALGTFCMALMANKPFAMAPGMGMNTFFATIVGNIAVATSVPYETAYHAGIIIILFEGLIFLIMGLLNLRHRIADNIPDCIKIAISPAIGMMLIYIGFGSNVSIYAEGNNYTEPFYIMKDFFGAMTPTFLKTSMGKEYSQMIVSVVTIFLGLFVILHFHKKRSAASVIFGIISSSVFYWLADYFILGNNPFRAAHSMSFIPDFGNLYEQTFLNFDFHTFFNIGAYTIVMVLITFCIIDMFGTIGSLVGMAANAGFLDKNGKLPKIKEALMSDAIGTVTGACTGSSTVVTFAESASGIQVGGKTGLTSFTTATLLGSCIFIAPLVSVIPPAATSTALIYIGLVMMQGLANIDFRDIEQVTPVFIMILAIAISGSVGNGIGLALICYTVIKMMSFKFREVTPLTYVVSGIFMIKFFVAV